jgi:chromosome condensin MukBEF MukE localization factor
VNETDPRQDHVRITEALFRFGAALPARDDFEQDLYREWHARDARRPGFTVYGRSPHLRGLTDEQLRELAQADVQAQAEHAANLHESATERQQQSGWEFESEPEAGF